MVYYGANHLVTTTFVQNHMKLRKNPKFIPSWENAPFDRLERSPRGIKFRLKIEGVFLLNPAQICAWLTNQSISLSFWPIWCPKCWMLDVQFFRAALRGYIASKSLFLIALFMPIYSKSVYFFDVRAILRLPKSSGD